VTGAKYQAHQNGQTQGQGKFSFNEPVGAAFEGTITIHAGLEGQGSLPNLNFEAQEHITVPAGGGIGATISNFRVTCQ
ncbi:MAG TPA: hypothetical protein VEU51_14410, partial [Candidatus Acidoferrales bacterium]|nr:hypothetical protein [Candidatus Acidoferrales bacterium]